MGVRRQESVVRSQVTVCNIDGIIRRSVSLCLPVKVPTVAKALSAIVNCN